MPKKILLAVLIALFIFPIFAQITSVSANHSAPITSPITNPITFFNLTGKVTYKRLGAFIKSAHRIMPAENVVIKIRGFFDHDKKYETKTDSSGNYMITLPPGLYKVEAKDGKHTFFVPPLRIVSIKEHKEKHADFQGLRFWH